jgi:hypothetical protein
VICMDSRSLLLYLSHLPPPQSDFCTQRCLPPTQWKLCSKSDDRGAHCLKTSQKAGRWQTKTEQPGLYWVLLFKLQPLPTISYLTEKITSLHIFSFITRTCMLIVWNIKKFWAFQPTWSKPLSIQLMCLLLVLYVVHIDLQCALRNYCHIYAGMKFSAHCMSASNYVNKISVVWEKYTELGRKEVPSQADPAILHCFNHLFLCCLLYQVYSLVTFHLSKVKSDNTVTFILPNLITPQQIIFSI